jgi:hypothetical protein
MSADTQMITFADILAGALGEHEAVAARRWLTSGAPFEPRPDPAGLVFSEEAPACYDTRVLEAGKRRHLRTQDDPAPKPIKRGPGATVPQIRRVKAPAANAYGRDSFVGHGDAIGTLARRRGRTAVEPAEPTAAPDAPDAPAAPAAAAAPPPAGPPPAADAAATAAAARPPGAAVESVERPLPAGWLLVTKERQNGSTKGQKYNTYRHEASGRSFRTYGQAKTFWETGVMPPPQSRAPSVKKAASEEAPPAAGAPPPPPPAPRAPPMPLPATEHNLPRGWAVYVLAEETPPGSGNLVNAKRFVSPEGLVCQSWPRAQRVAAAGAAPDLGADLAAALAWVRQLARAPRAAFALADAEAPLPELVALQRARAARYAEELKEMRRRAGKPRGSKRRAEEASPPEKEQKKKAKATPAEPPRGVGRPKGAAPGKKPEAAAPGGAKKPRPAAAAPPGKPPKTGKPGRPAGPAKGKSVL